MMTLSGVWTARPIRSDTRRCNLCLTEKLAINKFAINNTMY